MKTRKIVKIISISLACIIGFSVLLIGSYIAYVALQYYRIDDMTELKIENERTEIIQRGETYGVLSYNLPSLWIRAS